MRLTRRGLQVSLGLIWLLDALLQFQPAMFTRSFPDQVLRPAAQGNPAWVADPVTWAATLISQHVVLANAAFAIVQLVIALAILWRPTTALGLALSVPWALVGVVARRGPGRRADQCARRRWPARPGAVILYGLLAVLLWPAPDGPHGGSLAAASPLGPVVARLAWVLLWASLAYDTLLAASRAGLAALVSGQGAGEPGWLAAIDRFAGHQLGAHDAAVSAALAVIFAVIAVAVFIPAASRPVLAVAIALALAIWLVGENLGDVFTGQGTDPNTGPLLVLLALAYWPRRPLERPLPAAPAALPACRWPCPSGARAPGRRAGGGPGRRLWDGGWDGGWARGPFSFRPGTVFPDPFRAAGFDKFVELAAQMPVIFLSGPASFIEQAF